MDLRQGGGVARPAHWAGDGAGWHATERLTVPTGLRLEFLPPYSPELRPERLTGALLDRLTRHVHILEMNGDSYRLRQSKQRRFRT